MSQKRTFKPKGPYPFCKNVLFYDKFTENYAGRTALPSIVVSEAVAWISQLISDIAVLTAILKRMEEAAA